MANAKSTRRGRWWLVAALALAGALVAAWFAPIGQRVRGDATAGTAYAARVACSCRYVAGRSLADCAKDKLDGMALVRLSEDASAKSVTARVPLLASDTARFRPGYGCVMARWPG